MSKITDYSQVSVLDSSNVFLLDGSAGTKTIQASKLLQAMAEMSPNVAVHRMVYGGRSLGTSVSSAQLAAIRNGTFIGMLIGDYWTINGVKWVIVDFNYWLRCGNTEFTKPHLVMQSEGNLYSAKMNETNTTEGGYVGSQMYTTNLNSAKDTIAAAFPSMVLTHSEYLVNAVSGGKPSGGGWFDSTAELPNEIMMYGHPHFAPACDGSTVPALFTVNKSQLALYVVRPDLISIRSWFWLRDVVSSALFAAMDLGGHTNYYPASSSNGVRPVFAIG